jgi:hypothetical protein
MSQVWKSQGLSPRFECSKTVHDLRLCLTIGSQLPRGARLTGELEKVTRWQIQKEKIWFRKCKRLRTLGDGGNTFSKAVARSQRMSALEVVVVVFEFGGIDAAFGIGGQKTLDLRTNKLW